MGSMGMYKRDFLEWLVREQRNEEFAGAYEVVQEDGGSHFFLVTECDVYTMIQNSDEVRAAVTVGDYRLVSVREYISGHCSDEQAAIRVGNVMRHCVTNGTRRDLVN